MRNIKNRPRRNAIQTDESKLLKSLIFSILGIVLTISIVITGLTFFAPKIGSFFGFLSLNRGGDNSIPSIAPTPPTFTNPPRFVDETFSNISGVAQPGNTVKIFVNGPEKGSVIADREGKFLFSKVNLIEGTNQIYTKSIDGLGNTSAKSQTINVIVDKTKPEITIDSPADGEKVRNLDKRVEITGTLSEKADVTVNGSTAIVTSDLKFRILLGVDEGGVEIKVVATDEAGNSSEEIIFIEYEQAS